MSTLPIAEILRLYLNKTLSLNEVQDWLAQSRWEVEGREEELLDDLLSALTHLHDGFIDEKGFRDWAAYLLEREQDNIIPIVIEGTGMRFRHARRIITKIPLSAASTTADRGEFECAIPAAA